MDEARTLVNRVVRRTFTRSQILCPVDTGNLRASGRMELGSDRGALVIGGITYGARYAAAVHEGRRALTIRARRPGGKHSARRPTPSWRVPPALRITASRSS